MDGKLEGKVALITGGTTGIGLASAKLFLREGARLIITGSTERSVAAGKAELGERVEVLKSDAGDRDEIAALFEHVRQQYDGLDVLFLNAGIGRFAPIEQTSEEMFDELVRINLKGPWLALKHASPLLREGATVLVSTSIGNNKGMPTTSAYAATKAGLRALARVAAAELAPRNIRVNALSPGPTDTPIFDKLGMPADAAAALRTTLATTVPIKRLGSADEIAKAALFLVSSDSSFIYGTELAVDGGATNL